MIETVLVPTDGSPGAENAIARALDLAEAYGAAVHALYVVERVSGGGPAGEEFDELRDRSEELAREATERIRERAADRGLETVSEVREGVPYRTIVEYADEHGVDLVVMGTHGHTGAERARLGSTTERVITRSDVPVLSVRLTEGAAAPAPGDVAYDDVVVPTDGSDAAERAADRALEFAERFDAAIHVVYVVDTATYGLEDAPRSIVGLLKEGGRNATEAVATEARDRGLSATTTVRRGVPEEEILEYARDVGGDLIAMGTRGRAAPETDRLLGSTTARIVRRSEIPVLTVS